MYHYTQKALNFLEGIEGKRMLKAHPENQYGIWEVRGECTNPDFSGPHRTPLIGYYEGHLCDIINFAAEQKSFWAYGAGGSIKLIAIGQITPAVAEQIYRESIEDPAKIALKKEQAELEARLKEISEKLKE